MLYTKLNAIILCKTIFNIFLLINKYKFIVLENLNYPDCVFFFFLRFPSLLSRSQLRLNLITHVMFELFAL